MLTLPIFGVLLMIWLGSKKVEFIVNGEVVAEDYWLPIPPSIRLLMKVPTASVPVQLILMATSLFRIRY